jgi:poly-gamma-glutamate synthesis protein (capsule biosynthesis protein)
VSDGYDLRAKPAAVAALDAAGFDVVSLANNHALDAGEAGLAETVSALNAAGIAGLVETGVWQDSGVKPCPCPPLRGGGPLGVGGHTRIRYQLLAFDDSGVPLDLETAVSRVAAAAKQADLVIVSMHWGGEYQAAPSPRQQSIARSLAGAGADLIIGHGPHVLQRVEWIGETLVAYSLGNFLFDQPYPADCRWGAILRVTRFARGSRLTIQMLPTVVEQGRVRPASPVEAPAILDRLALEHRTKQ